MPLAFQDLAVHQAWVVVPDHKASKEDRELPVFKATLARLVPRVCRVRAERGETRGHQENQARGDSVEHRDLLVTTVQEVNGVYQESVV